MPILKSPNEGKRLDIKLKDGSIWDRFPVKTKIISRADKIEEIVENEIKKECKDGDILIIAESVVAIAEGRAFPISEIHPRRLAIFLSKYVSRVPWGIGLGRPETMELAIRDIGVFRILLASIIGGLFKIFGIKGIFYMIAGDRARSIDGPCDFKLPPYNKWASMGPGKPEITARKISRKLLPKEVDIVIIDANDIGTRSLGSTTKIAGNIGEQLTLDNPMGQKNEQTPFILARKRM